MNRLQDKVAIVTGAGRGIGRCIAETFAREGAVVIATSQSAHHDFVGRIEYVQQEVSEEKGWRNLVEHVVAKHGRVDVLVNNAGNRYVPRRRRAIAKGLGPCCCRKPDRSFSWDARSCTPHAQAGWWLHHQYFFDLGECRCCRCTCLSRNEGRCSEHVEERRYHLCHEEHPCQFAAPGIHRDTTHGRTGSRDQCLGGEHDSDGARRKARRNRSGRRLPRKR